MWQAACDALSAETLRRGCRLSTTPSASARLLQLRGCCSSAGASGAGMSPEELQDAVQQIVPQLTGTTVLPKAQGSSVYPQARFKPFSCAQIRISKTWHAAVTHQPCLV